MGDIGIILQPFIILNPMKERVHIHLLPTEKASRLIKKISTNTLADFGGFPQHGDKVEVVAQHIHVTIPYFRPDGSVNPLGERKIGDWLLHNKKWYREQFSNDPSIIIKCNSGNLISTQEHWDKITISSDKSLNLPTIQESFYLTFIDAYNSNKNWKEGEVDVEEDGLVGCCNDIKDHCTQECHSDYECKHIIEDKEVIKYILKLTAQNEVILSLVEDTLEEAAIKFLERHEFWKDKPVGKYETIHWNDDIKIFIAGVKSEAAKKYWKQQGYSREEVIKILKQRDAELFLNSTNLGIEEWIEENLKK